MEAHTETIRTKPEMLARFLRATARGWAFANKNRDQAVDMLIKEYPNLDKADERQAIDSLDTRTTDLRPDGGRAVIFGHDVWADPVAAKTLIGVLDWGLDVQAAITAAGSTLPRTLAFKSTDPPSPNPAAGLMVGTRRAMTTPTSSSALV